MKAWLKRITRHLRGVVLIENRLCFGGGYPKWHTLPKAVRWGHALSIFWLDLEIVWLGSRK